MKQNWEGMSVEILLQMIAVLVDTCSLTRDLEQERTASNTLFDSQYSRQT